MKALSGAAAACLHLDMLSISVEQTFDRLKCLIDDEGFHLRVTVFFLPAVVS